MLNLAQYLEKKYLKKVTSENLINDFLNLMYFTLAAALYVKVTLFESLKVVRAKKTRPISISVLEGEFKECFSILFPKAYIDQVISIFF